VKKRQGGAQRYRRASSGADEPAAGGPAHTGPLPPQHVQRKVNRKVKFLERVAASQKKPALAAAGAGVTKVGAAVGCRCITALW